MLQLENKEKPCKGTGNAKGFGCGKKTAYRKFGLCSTCQYEWSKTNDAGKIWFSKQLAYKAKKNLVEKKKEEDKLTFEMKIDLMSADKYRATYVQPLLNRIARFIDYKNPCMATGNFEGKMAGGHYTSVGSNRTICLNIHNIFIQSFASNSWNGGDDKKYREGLINTFGEDYLDFIESLKRHKPLHLKKPQLMEIKVRAEEIANKLEKLKRQLNPAERILVRNNVNLYLDIYDDEFLVYLPKQKTISE